jgi:hypothetical protein
MPGGWSNSTTFCNKRTLCFLSADALWRFFELIHNLALIGFSKPRCFQRLGYFAPLSFPTHGGKIQATRYAGGR